MDLGVSLLEGPLDVSAGQLEDTGRTFGSPVPVAGSMLQAADPSVAMALTGEPPVGGADALDVEFGTIMRRVEASLHSADRSMRSRGEQWMQRLALLAWVPQEEFRRDRNLHAELLLQCLEEGRWLEPLDRRPPDGPLPMLLPHVACALRHRRQRLLRAAGGQPSPFLAEAARAAVATPSWAGSATPADRWWPQRGRYEGWGQAPDASLWPQQGGVQPQSPPTFDDSLLSCFAADDVSGLASTASRRCRSQDATCAGNLVSLAGTAAAALGLTPPGGAAAGASTPPAYAALAVRVAHLQDENRLLRRQLNQVRARSVSRQQAQVLGKWSLASGGVQSENPRPSEGGISCSTPSGSLIAPAARRRTAAPRSRTAGHMWDAAMVQQPPSAMGPPMTAAATSAAFAAGLRGRPRSPFAQHQHLEFAAPDGLAMSNRGSCSPPRKAHTLMAPSTPVNQLQHQKALAVAAAALSRRPEDVLLSPSPAEDDVEGFLRHLTAFQEQATRLCQEGTPPWTPPKPQPRAGWRARSLGY